MRSAGGVAAAADCPATTAHSSHALYPLPSCSVPSLHCLQPDPAKRPTARQLYTLMEACPPMEPPTLQQPAAAGPSALVSAASSSPPAGSSAAAGSSQRHQAPAQAGMQASRRLSGGASLHSSGDANDLQRAASKAARVGTAPIPLSPFASLAVIGSPMVEKVKSNSASEQEPAGTFMPQSIVSWCQPDTRCCARLWVPPAARLCLPSV